MVKEEEEEEEKGGGLNSDERVQLIEKEKGMR